MIYRFTVPTKLPSLNDYIRANRTNVYKAAEMKRNIEYCIKAYAHDLPEIRKPVKLHFHWREQNKRRDLDNIASAKKFILDALVSLGVLENDSQKYVVGFSDDFSVTGEAGVMVEIEEAYDE